MQTDALTVAAAAAALPAAARAVVDAWTPAVAGLGVEGQADPLQVIERFTAARTAIAAAELDLLSVAVVAGARPTPSAVRCGYSASTLRRHLRALTSEAA